MKVTVGDALQPSKHGKGNGVTFGGLKQVTVANGLQPSKHAGSNGVTVQNAPGGGLFSYWRAKGVELTAEAGQLRIRGELTPTDVAVLKEQKCDLLNELTGPVLYLDFETASQVSLKDVGAHKYAQDESTTVLMMGWGFHYGSIAVWMPEDPFPEAVKDHIARGGMVRARNADFDRLVYWYTLARLFDVPLPALEQFECTAAWSRAFGLAGKLSHCAEMLELPIQKMKEGEALLRKYSFGWRPSYRPFSEATPEDRAALIEYCRVDVEVDRMICDQLAKWGHLSEEEWAEYYRVCRIGDRGFPVDLKLARAAEVYGRQLSDAAAENIREIEPTIETPGAIKTRDVWLRERLTVEQLASITETVTTDDGDVEKIRFDKHKRKALAAYPDLDADVMAYMAQKDLAGTTTMNKFASMQQRAVHGRVRGALIWHGTNTGRLASKGFQNLKRIEVKDPEAQIARLLTKGSLEDPTVLSQLVRCVISHKYGLSYSDYSSVQGRIAPWLSDCPEGEEKLQRYIANIDPYIYNASILTGRPISSFNKESPERHLGKLAELSCQFLAGPGVLQTKAPEYGIKLTLSEATDLVKSWRAANPWAVKFGRTLENAAKIAYRNKGEWVKAGRIQYLYDGDLLYCKKPSGRTIKYYNPTLKSTPTEYNPNATTLSAMLTASEDGGAPYIRKDLYAGKLIADVTQSVEPDILHEALRNIEAAGLDILHSTHDEVVVAGYHENLPSLMLDMPDWTKGLPLDADLHMGTRYLK